MLEFCDNVEHLVEGVVMLTIEETTRLQDTALVLISIIKDELDKPNGAPEGLFRVNGLAEKKNQRLRAILAGDNVTWTDWSQVERAYVLKAILGKLRDEKAPLFSREAYDDFIVDDGFHDKAKAINDLEKDVAVRAGEDRGLEDAQAALAKAHREADLVVEQILGRITPKLDYKSQVIIFELINLLFAITQKPDTKMTALNLAVVIVPNLFNLTDDRVEERDVYLPKMLVITEGLIHFHLLMENPLPMPAVSYDGAQNGDLEIAKTPSFFNRTVSIKAKVGGLADVSDAVRNTDGADAKEKAFEEIKKQLAIPKTIRGFEALVIALKQGPYYKVLEMSRTGRDWTRHFIKYRSIKDFERLVEERRRQLELLEKGGQAVSIEPCDSGPEDNDPDSQARVKLV